MKFEVKPIPPIMPINAQEVHDIELLRIITTAIRSCGVSGEDVGIKLAEVLKKIGRSDLVSSCWRGE